jgi:hypothetical protein
MSRRNGSETSAERRALAFEHLFGPVRALDGRGEWLAEVDEAIAGFYAAVAAEPRLADLLLVHSCGLRLAPGQPDLETGIEAIAALLRGGRAVAERQGATQPPPMAEDYLSRVIVSMAALRVRQDEAWALPADRSEMVLLIGNSYLGLEQTARFLARSRGAAHGRIGE